MVYTKITLRKINDSAKVGDKMPSHAIIAADSDYKNKITVGKLWMKQSDYGAYLSGELGKEYTNEAGAMFDGYVIITTKEYNSLKKTIPSAQSDGSVTDISDIPF